MLVPAKLSKVIVLEDKSFHTIIIEEIAGSRHFPIEIGVFEAIALLRKLENGKAPRPMTHDLLGNLLSALGANLRQVHIVDLREGTFFANLVLETDDGEITIDARPSDALVLAAQERCDLLVDDSVFEASISRG